MQLEIKMKLKLKKKNKVNRILKTKQDKRQGWQTFAQSKHFANHIGPKVKKQQSSISSAKDQTKKQEPSFSATTKPNHGTPVVECQ